MRIALACGLCLLAQFTLIDIAVAAPRAKDDAKSEVKSEAKPDAKVEAKAPHKPPARAKSIAPA